MPEELPWGNVQENQPEACKFHSHRVFLVLLSPQLSILHTKQKSYKISRGTKDENIDS